MSISLDRLKDMLDTFYDHRWADAAVAIPEQYPAVLRDFYRIFGGWIDAPTLRVPLKKREQRPSDPFGIQDRIHRSAKLAATDGHVEFIVENQGCFVCRVPIGQGDDPLVETSDQQPRKEGKDQFVSSGRRLSEVLVAYCLQEAVLSASIQEFRNDGDGIAEALGMEPLMSQTASGWLDIPTDYFISADHRIMLLKQDAGAFVGSNVLEFADRLPPEA